MGDGVRVRASHPRARGIGDTGEQDVELRGRVDRLCRHTDENPILRVGPHGRFPVEVDQVEG
jgi:hypothetical protein